MVARHPARATIAFFGNGSTAGFSDPQFRGSRLPTATANFHVRAHSYEVAANGATAEVGFPELVYSSGAREAELELDFLNIPSADSYDWSSFPPQWICSWGITTWSEPVLPGLTSGRVATGVNHAAQQRDSNFTLAVGVLFGIGGSALVAAAQEALHDCPAIYRADTSNVSLCAS